MYYNATRYWCSRHCLATNIKNSGFSKNKTVIYLMSKSTLQVLTLMLALCVVSQAASAKNLNDVQILRDLHTDSNYNQNQYHHYQHKDQQHFSKLQRRLQRDSKADITPTINPKAQCDAMQTYFETIDVNINRIYDQKGAICSGRCCSNSTELILKEKSSREFEQLLHHHTKNLRGILELSANHFQKHVLELVEQSENKTINVFSQVYRRMASFSRKLIHHLYSEIESHLKNFHGNAIKDYINDNQNIPNSLGNLENAVHSFFVNLFPVAYHQAVHVKDGELGEVYIKCLKGTFGELQPFGNIPEEIKQNLLQSVQTAQVFISSLYQSSDALGETDSLYGTYLTENCEKHLLKMSYCTICNGFVKAQIKTCYSYCINVLRGCSAQFASVLDNPWSNVVDAIDNLLSSYIHSESGIFSIIKQLDGKLSETIIRVMEKGPELEKKVRKACGSPKLIPLQTIDPEIRKTSLHNIKWATLQDTVMLRFLSAIEKSKDFFSNIVKSVCEDEDIQRNDNHCWNGERIGDYTQLVMTIGADTQRYNPEVPLETRETDKLNDLVDKLIKIRKNIGNSIPSVVRLYSDIQGDMARRDEEGSGHINDDGDDEEYGSIHGSGDSSGDGSASTPLDISGLPINITNDINQRSSATLMNVYSTLTLYIILVITLYGSRKLIHVNIISY